MSNEQKERKLDIGDFRVVPVMETICSTPRDNGKWRIVAPNGYFVDCIDATGFPISMQFNSSKDAVEKAAQLWKARTCTTVGGAWEMAESTKFEIDVSLYTEATQAPWWVIVKRPRVRARHEDCIDGPFFSREEAKDVLESNRHNYGPKAYVFCMSAPRGSQYRSAWESYRASGGKLPPEMEKPK